MFIVKARFKHDRGSAALAAGRAADNKRGQTGVVRS